MARRSRPSIQDGRRSTEPVDPGRNIKTGDLRHDEPTSVRAFIRIPQASAWPTSDYLGFRIEHRPFGDATLSMLTAPPGRLLIEPDLNADPRQAEFRLTLCLNTATIEADGRMMRMRRGDLLLFDLSQPCKLVADRRTAWLGLCLPRETITRRFGGAACLPAVFLPRAGVMTSLFRRCLFSLWRTDAGLPSAIAVEMAETKVDILMDAVREGLIAPENKGLGRLETLMRVSEVVGAHLSNPGFDAGALAVSMDMTPRRLAQILQDLTPTDLIRQLRLAQARRLLRTGALTGLTVTQIAHRVGFGNLTHFSTLYVETFGNAPNHDRPS